MNITNRVIPNTNYDKTMKKKVRVIIHWMAGNLASADAHFRNASAKVSAHYGVEDETIYRWVDESNTAYHCGVYAINQESIGIEHSAAPNRAASDKTYETAGRLLADICRRHNIPLTREFIEPHGKYKPTQCPGTMDIDRLIRIAKGSSDPSPGYPPTHLGQTVEKDGLIYESYMKDGKLLWKTRPAVDSQKELDAMRKQRDANWDLYLAEKEKAKKLDYDLQEMKNRFQAALMALQQINKLSQIPK